MAGSVAQQVSDPYAEALLSIGSGNNLIDAFSEDARFILDVLKECPEFGAFLGNPLLTADQKKGVLQNTLSEQVQPLMLNVLKLLCDRRRVLFLGDVCERYLALRRKLKKIALAEVISATELRDDQKQAVVERVKAMTQSTDVELETSIDDNLIGGVIVRVGSQVIDASLRGQIRRLSLQLAS
ncbi:MAG: ATP synthase F1 subunit delta [Cyanobacteria bacterium P01_F01_bin.33]